MVNLSIRLHKSQKNSKNQSPVVLQVTWDRKVRRKSTGVWVKEHQFYLDEDGNGRIQNVNGRKHKADTIKEFKKYGRRILEDHFEDVPFNYKKFSTLLDRKLNAVSGNEMTVSEYCKRVSKRFLKEGKVYSSRDYGSLANVIDEIHTGLTFSDFNEDFLKEVEEYIYESNNRGYDLLNRLKILYHKAIQDKYVDFQQNPFKNKYTNPYGFDISKFKNRAVQKTRRVKDLTRKQVKELKEYKPQTAKEEEYLDIWFFSYYCFGVNMIDLAQLKPEDIKEGRWYYQRSKTGVGLKQGKPLLPEALKIIEKYDDGSAYVFPILKEDMSLEDKKKRSKYYSDNMRRSLKGICKKLDWNVYCTFYSARHTSATIALNSGANKRLVSILLDHKNFSTIDNYAGRAETEELAGAMDSLRI